MATYETARTTIHRQKLRPPTFPRPAAEQTELKEEGKCPEDTIHRQVKYLNNVVEAALVQTLGAFTLGQPMI